MAVPARFGPEFRVNTATTGNQDSASVAALANGKFVVVWEDDGSGTNDVKGQIYNADGSKLGVEMAIAGDVGWDFPWEQQRPVVTGTGDGRFVVAWEDYFSGPPDITAQVFNSDGTSPTGWFSANTNTQGATAPAIAAFSSPANGRFLVSWSHEYSPTDTDVYARAYNAAGAFSPDAIPVNVSTAHETQSAVAGLTNGNYVAVWTDSNTTEFADDDGSHISAKIYAGNGVEIAGEVEFIVNSVELGEQSEPSVAALSDGSFVVVWTTTYDSGEAAILSRRFQADGTPSSEFGNVVANPFPGDTTQPTVTATATGYLIAWTDTGSADGSGSHIRAQLFYNDERPVGEQFVVDATVTAGSQFAPSVANLADGRFVITWTDPGADPAQADTSGNSVRAQIFDPRTAAATLTGSATLGDDLVGTPFGDTMIGQGGNDTLAGAGGDDTLGGGDNEDTLLGGDGLDQLFGNAGNDTLDGGAGDDGLDGGADIDAASYASAGSAVAVRLAVTAQQNTLGAGRDTLSNIENLIGSGFADTLTGNGIANRLEGGGGNDTLDGGAGDDQMFGGAGTDGMRGSTGFDHYDGGADVDTVNFALSTGVNVFLDGTGTNGKAALGDTFTAVENILGGVGADFIVGDGAANRLTGNTGNDVLWGRGGADILEGGTGADRLVGGAGNDALNGGGSLDWFVFDLAPAAGGIDRTSDFVHLTDKIEIDASAFGGGLTAGGAVQLVSGSSPTAAGFAGGVFLYDTDDGFLRYDADGQGAGAAVAFFRLQNLPGLTAADFVVVA